MRPWARTICDAAISSIALVIFCVDLMLLIRRRRMRSWPPAIGQSTFPVSNVSVNRFSASASTSPSGSLPEVRMPSRMSAWLARK